jgi:hypothetical protein
MTWNHLFQDKAFADTVMNFQIAQKAGNFLTGWATISFLKRFGFVELVIMHY